MLSNSLFIRTVDDILVVMSRPDQDYSNAAGLAANAVEIELGPGKTVASYVLAEGHAVNDYVVTNGVDPTDLQICQKSDVPLGRVIFPPKDVEVEDIPSNQSVLHGPAV